MSGDIIHIEAAFRCPLVDAERCLIKGKACVLCLAAAQGVSYKSAIDFASCHGSLYDLKRKPFDGEIAKKFCTIKKGSPWTTDVHVGLYREDELGEQNDSSNN